MIRSDQVPIFKSDRFKNMASKMGVQIILAEVESHSLLRVGENYHDPLQSIYARLDTL